MGARGKWWASSMSVLGARQMVSGGVKWQVAEANGVRHRQMVGAGGKLWEFKLKAVEANGGQRTRMAAEASGSCLMRVGRQIVGIGGCECWASEANGADANGGRSKWWVPEATKKRKTINQRWL